MIRNLLAVLILCAAASGSVTVHAVLTDGTGTVSKTAFLRFQLENCGANIPSARVPGKAAIQTNFDLRPNQVDGSILYTTLFGNDEIQCGGVFSTYWFVTVMKDQTHPLRDGLSYVLLSGTTFDPAVTPVMSVQQPAPAPPPLCCVSPLQGGSPGGNPGGGPVTFQLPCPTNVVVGANGYSTGNGGFNCDPFFIDDGVGNWTSQSGRTVGPVNGFLGLIGGSASPGSAVKYKLGLNEFRWLARSGTSEYTAPPATLCAVGQVWGVLSSTTDGNGDPVQVMQCQNSGTGVEAQVGGVDNANCTAGVCPLVNFIAGSNITITNPSGGQVQIASSGTSVVRALDPSTPTITPTGVTGATTYSYVIVGNQNCIAGTTFHSTASAVGSTSTGNATLTNSNYNLIAGYGDALYGYRGYDIYRTVGGATQGKIVTCAGKAFKDTGLTGDATTAPNTNTTQLDPAGLLRPGTLSCNSMFHSPDGVDAPPCTPNAADDEFTESSSLTPAGVNDGVWSAYNALSSTFALTNGTITLTSDTAANQVEGITIALPATPYTYIAYITMESTVAPNVCALSLLESSTGKNVGVGFLQNQALNSGSWAGGTVVTELVIGATTSFTGTSTNFLFDIGFSSGYFKIQNDGTNINISYSTGNDGVFYKSLPSQLVSSHYTSAPNKLLLWTGSSASGAGTCVVDYVRRIQ